jgi:hypothetical protein
MLPLEVDEFEPVPAPLRRMRAIASRLEDVLVAVPLSAADQAFLAIDAASPHLSFAPDPNDPSVRELRARAERDVPDPNDPSLRELRDRISRNPPIPNTGA